MFQDLLVFCIICSINSKQLIRASKEVHNLHSLLLWCHLPSSCLLCKVSLLPWLPCHSMTPSLYKDRFPFSKWLLPRFSSRQTLTYISQPQLDVPCFHNFPVPFRQKLLPTLYFNAYLVPFSISTLRISF